MKKKNSNAAGRTLNAAKALPSTAPSADKTIPVLSLGNVHILNVPKFKLLYTLSVVHCLINKKFLINILIRF